VPQIIITILVIIIYHIKDLRPDKAKSHLRCQQQRTLFIFLCPAIREIEKKRIHIIFYFICAFFTIADLMPTTVSAGAETREFLLKVIDVLLDFVKATNDRNEKVLDFHHPEDMKRLLDLDVPDRALPLQQLIEDCATTLKYQVKTGKFELEKRGKDFPRGSLSNVYTVNQLALIKFVSA